MKKIFDIISVVVASAPKVRYYANLVIHIVDMLDGVQDWQKVNSPPTSGDKK